LRKSCGIIQEEGEELKAEATMSRCQQEGDRGGGSNDREIRQWHCPSKKSGHEDVVDQARCLARRAHGIQKRRVVVKMLVTELKC
jgi:hypothetical protein